LRAKEFETERDPRVLVVQAFDDLPTSKHDVESNKRRNHDELVQHYVQASPFSSSLSNPVHDGFLRGFNGIFI
jgi:hypothetical protein